MITKILNHIKKDEMSAAYTDYLPALTAIIQYYYFEKLEWCGCGDSTEALKTVGRYLYTVEASYPQREERTIEMFGVHDIYENNLLLCLAYAINEAGLTDHGTSIRSCWLTEDGEYFLWAIQEAERTNQIDNIMHAGFGGYYA